GLWWVSDVVRFENEWRYYVADGDVVAVGWYDGTDEDLPPPPLNVDWPSGFSGAVDFGLVTGEMTLVEAHAPFACGWYGDDPELFVLWQTIAWEHRDFWLSADQSAERSGSAGREERP
ncbi:MAG: ATP-grasp domain-containing protein, partial [Betaproteobacteria bacterium]